LTARLKLTDHETRKHECLSDRVSHAVRKAAVATAELTSYEVTSMEVLHVEKLFTSYANRV